MRRSALRVGLVLVATLGCATACGDGGPVLTGYAGATTHTVVLSAGALEPLEVQYLDAKGHRIRIADAGAAWSLSLTAPNGRWVSFVASPAATSGIEVVTPPHCAISVDGRVVARSSDRAAVGCDLAGWVGAKPPRSKAPGWIGTALLLGSLLAFLVGVYRTRRLAMPG